MRGLSLLGAVWWVARAAAAGTVWIDTDVSIGSPIRDVDDAYALVLAFHSPEIRIAGISTSYGNAPLGHTTRAARDLVQRFGGSARVTVGQVVAGATSARDLGRSTGASEALAKRLGQGSLTYIALGPLTNLASFLQLHPDRARRIERVIFLGGQAEGTSLAFGPRGSFRIHDANVFKDPTAAAVLLRSKTPMTLVPVMAAAKLIVTREDLRDLERQAGAASYLARRSKVWLWFWTGFLKTEGGAIFDALGIAAAANPRLLSMKQRYARMDENGNLMVGSKGSRAVSFCTGTRPEAKSWVLQRLVSRRGRD